MNDPEFSQNRQRLQQRIAGIEAETAEKTGERRDFFEAVYDRAGNDATQVPWADLAPKETLSEWLALNPGKGRSAIDVACGLGDNAEAISNAGYRTAAFDYAEKAVAWARERFPDSPVDYRVADLFDLPEAWLGAFDLVHECYTIQSVPPDMHSRISRAIASLVAPGGTLLVITRVRDEGGRHDGPPWPLTPGELREFSSLGFELIGQTDYEVVRPDRRIRHARVEWRRTAGISTT